VASQPTFSQSPTFLGLDRPAADADVRIVGIPFDIGTSNRSGARFGPQAIRSASRMLIDGDHPLFWVEPATLSVADQGNLDIALGDIDNSLRLIERQAESLPHIVALGGDHTVTLPLLRALRRRQGRLGLIHVDAHVDTWPESFGQRFGHGSPFYHAIVEDLIDPRRYVQVGIRSPVHRPVFEWTKERGVTIVSASDVHEQGPAAIAGRIVDVVGEGLVYLSFDIDALDPAFAPGTGTPEIGGLATWQVQAIIRRLSSIRFAGMDVVEVSPAYDSSEITALAAATMVWEYLALLARSGVLTDRSSA
jgi:agmatinase